MFVKKLKLSIFVTIFETFLLVTKLNMTKNIVKNVPIDLSRFLDYFLCTSSKIEDSLVVKYF